MASLAAPSRSAQERVLLAEDHPQMREMMCSSLAENFQVLDALGRGDEVMEAAARLQPDAIILDISLPGRSGLQLLKELRSKLPRTALVLFTAHDHPAYKKEALRLGADDLVSKTSSTDLASAIRSALSKHRSEPCANLIG